jgi:formylglycine-generating enzyme required for sulfatase activity
VTGVSWFAAKAYCASVGLRLPTTIEWERALSVVGRSFLASTRAGADTNPAASLWEWTADFNSLPVADGGSVANLFCGAGARATDATDYSAFLRYSFRSSLKADFTLKNLGFRCAQGTP